MRFPACLLPLSCLAAAIPLFASTPSTLPVTFDASAITAESVYTTSDLYVSFQSNAAKFTIGTTTVTMAGKVVTQVEISGTNQPNSDMIGKTTTAAFTLADIASGTMSIDYADSLIAFISYGSAEGIELQTAAPSQFTTKVRFSQFEVSFGNVPGISGFQSGADLTNISQFGGSLKLELLNSNQDVVSSAENSQSSIDMINDLVATSAEPSFSTVTLYIPAAHPNPERVEYVRVIGPNSYPSSIVGIDYKEFPYRNFNGYLKHLLTTYPHGNDPKLSDNVVPGLLNNLKPGQSHGQTGAVGLAATGTTGTISGRTEDNSSDATMTITNGDTYNLDYEFAVVLREVKAPNGDFEGTYEAEIRGRLYITNTSNTTIRLNDLIIKVDADTTDVPYMTQFLYLQSMGKYSDYDASGINSTIGVSFNDEWSQLLTAFGATNLFQNIMERIGGDFSEGILSGLIGSTVQVDIGGGTMKAIGELSSYEWYQEQLLTDQAYSIAQTSDPRYSEWGNVIYLNSPGKNVGGASGNFSYGAVYGSPFDDRFDTVLMSPGLNGTVAMKVTLKADGDFTTTNAPIPLFPIVAYIPPTGQPAPPATFFTSEYGSISVSPATGPYNLNDSVTFTAHPNAGYEFVSWLVNGNVPANDTTNPYVLDLSAANLFDGTVPTTPEQILAKMQVFFQNDTSDTDGDSLTAYEEVIVYGTNPGLYDSDLDEISDGQEVSLGLDPLLSDADLVSFFVDNATQFNLLRQDQRNILSIGTEIERGGTDVDLTLQPYVGSDLGALNPVGSPFNLTVPNTSDPVMFFQVETSVVD